MTNERDTLPAPEDMSFGDQLRQLQAALEHASELCVKLSHRLGATNVALIVQDHKTTALERRVAALEKVVAA